MPINTAVDGAVKGYITSKAIRADLAEALAQVGFADLFRGPGTVAKADNVRIDVQGRWTQGPGNNIQAQVGNTSIAALRIADSLGAAQGAVNQAAVLQAAQAALTQSGADGSWRELTGTSP